MVDKLKAYFANKWVKFSLATLVYILWFCVWSGFWWAIIGVVVIYDVYISGYIKRYVGEPNEALCLRSPIYRTVYEWVNALVFATVVATIIHTYIFQLYVIPTSSMEKSLLVGDYLYVSKVAYGPKMPNTPIAFPFVHHTMPFSTTKQSFSDAIQLPYNRLNGVKPIKRNDVVVFNFPAGDTVLLENQSATYYDVLRAYQSTFGDKQGRERLNNDYTIITRPIDKRENYIKRLVGMPGDIIVLKGTKLFVNGEEEAELEGRQHIQNVRVSQPMTRTQLRELNITELSNNGSLYQMPLTKSGKERLSKANNVVSIDSYEVMGHNPDVFPHDTQYPWNQDNFGPLWIPEAGATIELTLETLPLYERIISLYEGNDLRVDGDTIYVNDQIAQEYTFKMNYYWMMGDNRHNSADSRFWGFVPEDHIVGKASFVWLSLDSEGSFPFNIRWDRIFKKIQ
ncbi:MAG: signal peptidase I [Rikenellaceae bacterium]